MQNISKAGYTDKEIKEQLHFKHGSNEIKFRYDLLDKNEMKKSTLNSVIDGEISMAMFAQVKRTAKFQIAEGEDIDWLNDRIQPFFMLKMPPTYYIEPFYNATVISKGLRECYGDHPNVNTQWCKDFRIGMQQNPIGWLRKVEGKWIEWPLGIFLLSTPTRVEQDGRIIREVEAYDGLIVLKDDKFLDRYFIAEGTKYTDAVITILQDAGISKINIENNDAALNRDKEFEAGTERLQAINELLKEINYTTLWVDEQGYYVASRYTSPANRAAEYNYFDNEVSILSSGMEEELDLVSVANSWVVVASNPEEEPLVSSYINDNPDSPTSTVNRGRTIADFREIDSIANQTALDEYTKRLAFNASQIYGYLTFETALNPLHSYSDVLNIRYKDLGIDDKYSETNWTMPLKAGEKMSHSCRKVVKI